MIGNYNINEEQAGRIPCIFHPELAETDLPKGFSVKQRYDERPAPMIEFYVDPNSICRFYLAELMPLVTNLDLASDNKEDFLLAKDKLERVVGFKLIGIEK